MKLRTAKKLCKEYIRKSRFKVAGRHGRTFVIEPTPNFLCARWYAFIVASTESDKLKQLIEEGKLPIRQWKAENKRKYEQRT